MYCIDISDPENNWNIFQGSLDTTVYNKVVHVFEDEDEILSYQYIKSYDMLDNNPYTCTTKVSLNPEKLDVYIPRNTKDNNRLEAPFKLAKRNPFHNFESFCFVYVLRNDRKTFGSSKKRKEPEQKEFEQKQIVDRPIEDYFIKPNDPRVKHPAVEREETVDVSIYS